MKSGKLLTEADFPLRVEGTEVYARTRKVPICVARTARMATEIAETMNRDFDWVAIPRMTLGPLKS